MTKEAGGVVWRDRRAETIDELRAIANDYGFHELQTRMFTSKHRRPQAIESDDVLLVNFLVPQLRGKRLKIRNFSAIVTKQGVVTVHESDLFLPIAERLAVNSRTAASASGMLAVIADVVTEQYAPVLDAVDEKIDQLEDIMVSNPTDKELHELFEYKRLLADLRRIVLPTTSMLDAMSDGRFSLVEKQFWPYLRDSYDYSWRTHELIDTLRDLLTSALDTYLSVVSNRLNDVMKRLTMVATIFMPISFIVGFGGMNFVDEIPFGNVWFFAVVMGLLIVVPVSMLAYFRYKKWL